MAAIAYVRRHIRESVELGHLMTCWFIWALFLWIESIVPVPWISIAAAYLKYIGIIGSLIFIIRFTFVFTRTKLELNRNRRIYLLIVPVLILLFIFTNPLHHWFWSSINITVHPNSAYQVNYEFAIGFWIVFIYIVSCYVLCWLILMLHTFMSSGLQRKQAAYVYLGLAIPPSIGLIVFAFVKDFSPFGIFPLAFPVSVVILIMGVSRAQLFKFYNVNLDTVIEKMNDGVMIFDSKYRLLYANSAIQYLLQINPTDSIQKPIQEIIAPLNVDVEKLISSPLPYSEVVEMDERIVAIYLSALDVAPNEGARQILYVRDITEKQQIETAEYKARQIAHALQATGIALTSTLELKEILDTIFDQARKVVSFDTASVSLLEGDGYTIRNAYGFTGIDVAGFHFAFAEGSPNKIVADTLEPLLVNDVKVEYPKFCDGMPYQIGSWLGIPLKVKEELIGLLTFGSVVPNHFTEEDKKIAGVFGHQVSIAVNNAEKFNRMEQLAITDDLTGLASRRRLFEQGEIETDRALRYNRPLSLIMLDLDDFKLVNDRCGHKVGDLVLQHIANDCIRNHLRKADLAGRYGGEEFVLILPETDMEGAAALAERIRASCENHPTLTEREPIRMTISLGISSLNGTSATFSQLLDRADNALYKAKKHGKNRVEAEAF